MFHDREYFTTLVKIALPIAIQNFISSSLNAVGVLLIGQLGDTSVAAVGLANQVFFLFSLMLFGITSGSAIFTAQYWGSGDLHGIRKIVLLCLSLTLAPGIFFTVIAIGFPQVAMGLYTRDPAVIKLGSDYLQIIGISYLATAVSFTFASQMRSTGSVRPPMLVSVVALGLGTLVNYTLIFGKFGLPVMGVRGAALGTCLARLVECAAMLAVTYLGRFPTAARLADFTGLSQKFFQHYSVIVLPVAANETIWALGITIYNMIYARIGTEAIAAINITSTIDSMAFVVFIGISNASAIMIGNRIGAGEEEKAIQYARRALILGIALALVMGALVLLFSGTILAYYKVSETAAVNARGILTVLACGLWMRVTNMIIIAGILRSGGDTRFAMFLDICTVWFVGIPMALLGTFVFHLPVYWVVTMVMADELTKFIGGIYRFRTHKWINNLAHSIQMG
jgi:putative MATE family efflux protein